MKEILDITKIKENELLLILKIFDHFIYQY